MPSASDHNSQLTYIYLAYCDVASNSNKQREYNTFLLSFVSIVTRLKSAVKKDIIAYAASGIIPNMKTYIPTRSPKVLVK